MRACKIVIVAVAVLGLAAPHAGAAEVDPRDPRFDLQGEAMAPPDSAEGVRLYGAGGMVCLAPKAPGRTEEWNPRIGVTITSDSSEDRATARFTVGGGAVLDRASGTFTNGPIFEIGTGEVTVVRVDRSGQEPIERPGPGAGFSVLPLHPGDPNHSYYDPDQESLVDPDGHPDARYSCAFGDNSPSYAQIVYRTPIPYPTETELQTWCDANLVDWRDPDDYMEMLYPGPRCPLIAGRPAGTEPQPEPEPEPEPEPQPEPEPAPCIRATNVAHLHAGRATWYRWRAYAAGTRDDLGRASRYVTTSLRERTDGGWEEVASC